MLSGLRDKVVCVYPPVDMPPVHLEVARAWQHDLGFDGRRLIGFAGRWVEEKGFDDLLRALPFIRQQEPDAHLVYADDPHVVYEDFFARCQPLIEAQRDHITFLGLIRDPHRMAVFYAMCDLLALPSRTEMLALVQIEALLCGTPVVATDIPGGRVVVRETGMGRLAPAGDPAGLARAIVDVLGTPQAYRPDRLKVQSIFDGERSLARYESLLEGMLHAPAVRWPKGAISRRRVSKGFSDR